ncbi:MAG: glycosyltransferase family 4 protein [Fulvivirga sp.]
MAKKVVHILYGGLGGHGQVVFTLLNQPSTDQNVHLIFYGVESPLEEYIVKCNIKSIKYTTISKSEGEYVKPLIQIYRQLKKIRPHIIFTHSSNAILPSILYAVFRRSNNIFVEHHANHLKSLKEWFLSFNAMLFANNVIFLSEPYRSEVKSKLGLFFNNRKARVIPNGIDLKLFSPLGKNQNTTGKIVFGMASRLAPTKDHKTLIKAFSDANINNAILEIAGSGETQSSLKQFVVNLDISDKVIFTGMLSQDELITFFKRLDVYVHASFGETMSIAIAQAQACGLPIIASDVKGINNVIHSGENGILFKTTMELCEALKKLTMDESLRKNYAKASRQYAIENLSDEIMSKEYAKLISQ